MKCKICNKEIDKKFYRHLNSNHRMKKGDYLSRFPEQEDEYNQQKPVVWNKGLTAKDNSSVAKYTEAIREYSRRPEVRQKQSDRMKLRYAHGDILDAKTRARVVKSGNDGWIRKLKDASDEERKELLKAFTTAGNKSQKEKRHLLTPEDYNRMYPFAKGVARYHNCDYCGKQKIAWFGGKPRPKKRFCDEKCYQDYCFLHPSHTLPKTATMYYSTKMETEFCLRSKLELWLAQLFDNDKRVASWCTPPFHIKYEWLGKQRRYYPDFLVSGKYVIEVKSDYVRRIQGEDRTVAKLNEAEVFCQDNGYEFLYWQFDGPNQTKNIVLNDSRILNFVKNCGL